MADAVKLGTPTGFTKLLAGVKGGYYWGIVKARILPYFDKAHKAMHAVADAVLAALKAVGAKLGTYDAAFGAMVATLVVLDLLGFKIAAGFSTAVVDLIGGLLKTVIFVPLKEVGWQLAAVAIAGFGYLGFKAWVDSKKK